MKCLLFTFYVTVIVSLYSTPFCNGQSNTDSADQTVTDAGQDAEEKTPLQRGMDPVFKMYHGFLDTVMPNNFYEESDSAFSVQDLITITKDDDYSRLSEDWQSLTKTFGGIAACIIFGLLFLLFMPIVGCIYCCCHCCCHKCGGTREQNDPKYAKCKRVTYTTLLLIFTTLMLAGAIVTFLGAELLHQSLKNEDNDGLLGSMDKSLGHMQTFVNTTLNEIKVEARTKIVDEGLNGILKSITETALTTVTDVQNAINATDLLNQAENIGKVAEKAFGDLTAVGTSLGLLKALQMNVTTILGNVTTDVDRACPPNGCPGVDTSKLTFNPDFASLDELGNELKKVEQADNITGLVEQARNEFKKVSEAVNSSISNEITSADKVIDDIKTTISDALANLDGKADGFVEAMKDGRVFTKEENEDVQMAGNYIWYTCIGMACAVLLVVVFYYLGVLFGLCGERPTHQAACCNKGTGANLICTGICCSFLFCWILMLVVVLTFTLGGLSYSLACKYLGDGVEHIDTFEDVISEGFGWNISNTFNTTNLTIAGMFSDCKENKGVYTALNLKFIFDIDKEFDTSGVEAEVQKIINTTSITVSEVTLLSPSLRQQLEDFTQSNLKNINYTQYLEQTTEALFGVNLTATINTLNETANQAVETSTRDTLQNAVTELQTVRDVLQPQITEQVANLTSSIRSLEANSDVTDQIADLIVNIDASQTEFNNNRDKIVTDKLKDAASNILKNITKVVTDVKAAIKNDIGRCRELYNAAQTVVNSICVVTLDPFNAIWFGLGWSLFFYIPSFIFAALLASLYKRTNKYVELQKPDFDDVTQAPYTGYDNSYQGNGPREERYPLTRVDNPSRDKVGSSNHAYEGRDQDYDSRYHRDSHGAQPYHVGYPSQGAGGASRGPTYARPHAGPQEPYNGYDMTPPPRYEEVRSHGGYPKLRNY